MADHERDRGLFDQIRDAVSGDDEERGRYRDQDDERYRSREDDEERGRYRDQDDERYRSREDDEERGRYRDQDDEPDQRDVPDIGR